jgi:glucose/arabinose dehydrogenase
MPKLTAKRVASGLARPVFVTAPPGDKDRLFVVEQHTGKVRILKPATGAIEPTPFLQVTGLSAGNEQGLLGLAFAPDFATSGAFYVSLTDATGTSVIRRHKLSAADPNVANPAGTVVLTVPQPFANHNGGWIDFGPKDKFLYLGLGDGGSEGDPNNTSQNPQLLLGKLLRLDVGRNDFPGDPARSYGIPPDNPFVNKPGTRPEIWALGLRNPWRCGFDRQTGDLYIGDVGQDKFEEIDFQPAASKGGENYGWSLKEGKHPFKPNPSADQTLVDPIDEYSHDDGGIAVIGGYVYRGAAIPALAGTYFYADVTGTVTTFRYDGQNLTEKTDRTAELFPGAGPSAISSFGEDAAGELYLVNLTPGEVYRIDSQPDV